MVGATDYELLVLLRDARNVQYTVAPQSQGSDPTVDSDAMPITLPNGNAAALVLFTAPAFGEFDDDKDIGLVPPSRVTGNLFEDGNGDGQRATGEPPINGARITLRRAPGDPPISTTTTAPDGSYVIGNLTPGETYYVCTCYASQSCDPVLETYVPTVRDVQNNELDDVDSDGAADFSAYTVCAPFTAPPYGSAEPIDIGFQKETVFGDFVWLDNNGDGLQSSGEPPLENVVVSLDASDRKSVV